MWTGLLEDGQLYYSQRLPEKDEELSAVSNTYT